MEQKEQRRCYLCDELRDGDFLFDDGTNYSLLYKPCNHRLVVKPDAFTWYNGITSEIIFQEKR